MNLQDTLVYEKIARKDLSFGCKFIRHWTERKEEYVFTWAYKEWYLGFNRYVCLVNYNIEDIPSDKNTEIIGHPILLSDILAYARSKNLSVISWAELFEWTMKLWNLQIPTYEKQSEETKEFIRNIIK